MTDDAMFDILRQIGCRISVAAHIIRTSQEGDSIRDCIPTLIEDSQEDMQALCLEYCAVEEESLAPTGQ